MINLPAELGWVSENLPLSHGLRLGLQGRFSLTDPRSAGRFIPYCICIRLRGGIYGKIWPELKRFPEGAALG